MLFSGGDFPKTLSSILSGEGFDESEQGNRRFTFGLPEPLQRRKVVTPDYRFRLLFIRGVLEDPHVPRSLSLR
jgi:hypothetical protein